jgi:2-oxoglutarate ferredoxin oxidoreductase subunit alpha
MTETPIVIIDIMRSGPSTGMPTAPSQGDILQARFGSHGDYPIIVLTPATVTDMYHLTEKAFRLAEKYLVPVIVMADEITAHMKESVDLPELRNKKKADQRRKPTTKKRECLGMGLRRHKTGLAHDISGMPTTDSIQYEKLLKRLMSKIDSAKDLVCTKLEGDEEPEVVLLAYGSPYRSAKAAMKLLKKDGIRSALLKLEIIWPFPENIVKEISKKAVKLIVPEMNMGHIIREVERVAEHPHEIISVSSFGHLMTPETIVEALI